MIIMGPTKKQKIKTHIATVFERSEVDPDRDSMFEKRELRHQRILQGLTDVDKANVVSHTDLVCSTNRLKKL